MTLAWYDRGMMIRCVQCGSAFEATGRRGPSPLYCSSACRARQYRLGRKANLEGGIPAEMRALRRWVRCDDRKRPVDASGRPMSWTDPSTWMTFLQASEASYGAGRGLVLGEGIGCIDLDGCIGRQGELSLVASNVLRRNPGAYVERSQSGRGLHVFGWLGDVSFREKGYEVYGGAGAKRFIWVTGDEFRRGGMAPLVV